MDNHSAVSCEFEEVFFEFLCPFVNRRFDAHWVGLCVSDVITGAEKVIRNLGFSLLELLDARCR